ncbi:Protein OPI10 [Wickerhamiella sorbophila]|uniref:Protein OPI10 n=1 Tax=Wickerhamiella sorbophila TaxID=45607 RepID=A0A2T0FCF2_9ASCO|nr:Protein OPI10 [Wickerhamiella sorbophila]PRT52619.1 Protein OPI10 [Wickerhamiella sorbophila]
MFGIVCGGRPVDTNVQQIEPVKFVYVIQEAAKINHMAIFLLPGTALPPGSAASVYAQLPGKDFSLLGVLTEEKQSAIFRFNIQTEANHGTDVDMMMDDVDGTAAVDQFAITIGISLEPLEQAELQLAAAKQAQVAVKQRLIMPAKPVTTPAPDRPDDIASLANKIVTNAYNYMSSFVSPQGQVPIKAFDEWWNKFKAKLAANPSFLNNLD